MFTDDDAGRIARAFRLGDGAAFTGTLARGEQGQVVQLETSSGLWAVKTSFRPPELDGEDGAFQAAAVAAGVPAPIVVFTDGGELFAEIRGLPVRVYRWVDVLPADSGLDPGRVGRLLATIHQVPFRGRRLQDPWYTEPIGAAGWNRLVERLAAARAPFAGDLVGMCDELVALEALLVPARELRTCHRDLWSDNLRATSQGELCVIDWDNCGQADPGQELAGVVFEFGYGDADRARALYGEYRRCGGPGRIERRGDFSMTIAQLGHINEMSCLLWLDSAQPDEERARQACRFHESVEMPLTVAVIDELLQAVAG
ncbi:MAG: phosphotransferase [Gaiellales bacterium]